MANKQLSNAKSVKNDEFYTRLEDINAELVHYEKYFKGKVIFMNCDDPTWSNFWRYFHIEFERLGLKKIISTHYESGEVSSYMMTYEGGNDEDFEMGVRTELTQNGDFRSPECIELLKEADIVVTNPPFSLFREYVTQLMEYNKKFIIMGNKNAITYKEFFPLLKDNKVWVGATSLNGGRWMIMPKNINIESDKAKKDSDGNTILNVAGVCWFTNLENKKRTEKIETPYLYAKKDDLYPELYPKYDNYDAINIDKVTEIPMDYFESWGISKDNFTLLQQENWEITRTETIDEIEYFWIIPSIKNPLYKDYKNKSNNYKSNIAQTIKSELYCSGNMGVPITFFDKYNPNQFEIINANDIRISQDAKPKPHGLIKDKEASITIISPNKDITHTHTHTTNNLCTNCGQKSWHQVLMDGMLKENENMQGSLFVGEIKYCSGIMGIPITFMDKYNPEQFEIIGWSRHNDLNMDGGYWLGGNADATINDKIVYRRILIKRKDGK